MASDEILFAAFVHDFPSTELGVMAPALCLLPFIVALWMITTHRWASSSSKPNILAHFAFPGAGALLTVSASVRVTYIESFHCIHNVFIVE